jgi:hypothetical protein
MRYERPRCPAIQTIPHNMMLPCSDIMVEVDVEIIVAPSLPPIPDKSRCTIGISESQIKLVIKESEVRLSPITGWMSSNLVSPVALLIAD